MSTLRSWTRVVEFLALVTAPFVILVAVALVLDNGSSTSAATAAERTATPARGPIPTFQMTVVTDAQTGRSGDIVYVPTNLTLPAHSTVRIRIANFDGATPQQPATYAKVWGTVGGTIQVQSFNLVSPNKLGAVHTVRSLSAATDVSHTFTVPGLHLNVPVAPQGVTTFVVHTGAPGHYDWRCFNPCGDGPTGWGGAMADRGFMSGVITVS